VYDWIQKRQPVLAGRGGSDVKPGIAEISAVSAAAESATDATAVGNTAAATETSAFVPDTV
jgi:hypothetical protein